MGLHHMDTPLTKWYCDVCGEPIVEVKNGYVIWKTTDDDKSHSFKIIHKNKCDLKAYIASASLEDFLGAEGLAYLLSKLSYGSIMQRLERESHCEAADMDEFVDFMRRVQTPFYEEARRVFGNLEFLQDSSGDPPDDPYYPEALKKIIMKYGNG